MIPVAAFLFISSFITAGHAEFNWKRCAGVELRVLLNRHPWQEAIQPLIPQFEALTGIKVHLDIYPEDWFQAKRTVELASNVAKIDVTILIMAQEGQRHMDEGWAIPLEKFISDPNLTNPNYDTGDFLKGAWEAAQVEGKQIGIPITMEIQPMFFFRKDLLKKYRVAYPKTMEELVDAAKKLTLDTDGDGRIDIHGIAMRGKKAAATSVWAAFLHSYGGEWLDANRNPVIDSPEAIAAFEMYGRLLRESGPANSIENDWYEVVSLVSHGKAAFACDASLFCTTFENPKKSKVAGKIGYGILPAGPKGSVPSAVVWSLIIPHLSKNPEAAWLFIQWATSKETALRLLKKRVTGGRASSWNDPEIAKLYPQDFIEAFREGAMLASSHWNPPVNSVNKVRDLVGEVIVDAILGKDVKNSARKAALQIRKILEVTKADQPTKP
ncbi:MAG: sugar ABC transporter substrate-binding protein [Deltaproteobacteria bacterium]|nr:sugar ABC transporter substrate-binding protein [Deltaproteobacteria bacterium]